MPGKIKCTYDDCFRHFNTVEAMKKHKEKDSAHDAYCKKCDVDCNDDIEYMYHQIVSPKHVACPICGREFKSESGRDRHVEIEHIPKQNIKCVGCEYSFDRASALMSHIERNECPVIKNSHFQRQRAEREVIQDAWEGSMDPTAGATVISNARAVPTVNNEMNLLDDERAYVNTDWQGRPQYDENNEQNGPYVDPPSAQFSNLAVSRFPPLGHESRSTQSQPDRLPSTTGNVREPSDLMKFDNSSRVTRATAPAAAWGPGMNSASRLFQTQPNNRSTVSTSTRPAQVAPSVNLLDTFTDEDFNNHTRSRDTASTTHLATPSSLAPQPTTHPNTIPPSTTASNPNPNSPNARIRTTRPLNPPARMELSNFFDTVTSKYVCPTIVCGRHFPTPQAFIAHLSSPPHLGAQVSCPSCFKRFKTTTSLIAHCESGSRKCRVRDTEDFDRVIRAATAGLMAVDGYTEEGGNRIVAQEIHQW